MKVRLTVGEFARVLRRAKLGEPLARVDALLAHLQDGTELDPDDHAALTAALARIVAGDSADVALGLKNSRGRPKKPKTLTETEASRAFQAALTVARYQAAGWKHAAAVKQAGLDTARAEKTVEKDYSTHKALADARATFEAAMTRHVDPVRFELETLACDALAGASDGTPRETNAGEFRARGLSGEEASALSQALADHDLKRAADVAFACIYTRDGDPVSPDDIYSVGAALALLKLIPRTYR